MKLNNKLHRLAQEGGFTLIEMLIVVAIIAILVSIAVPAMLTAKNDAMAVRENSLRAAIETAKNRALLKDEIVKGSGMTPLLYSQFSKYLLINGVNPPISQVTNGTANGTGKNIISWGNAPYAFMSGTLVDFPMTPITMASGSGAALTQ